MRQKVLISIQIERARGVIKQLDRLLAAIENLRMGADDVFLLIGVEDELDLHQRYLIL